MVEHFHPHVKALITNWVYPLILLILLVNLSACKVSTPLTAPAGDPSGTWEGEGGVTIGLTLAITGKDRAQNKVFWHHVKTVQQSLADGNHTGLIGFSIRREIFGHRAWTMTVWKDGESLDAFVMSEVHQKAMEGGSEALTGSSFARIIYPGDRLPLSWEEAEGLLEREGRHYGTAHR